MFVKGFKPLAALVGPLIIGLYLILRFHLPSDGGPGNESSFFGERTGRLLKPLQEHFSHETSAGSIELDIVETHREVFSVSTTDRQYFLIDFGERQGMNPNIIPHPILNDTWIVVAQEYKSPDKKSLWFAELVCDAVFTEGRLGCIQPPVILPIAATSSDKCVGDFAYFDLSVGPHDARVFYGPRSPYTIYGSNSMFTCFGQWMSDFRLLVDWGAAEFTQKEFRMATELQRPPPYGIVEKNWFVFWDKDERIHAHYDIDPKRAFAQLRTDGSVGEDLGPIAAASDEKCMAKYMPRIGLEIESVHQATNSLSITLCDRSDPFCEVNDSNTFILTIFQHKTYHSFHSVYEPYVMLFKQAAPFEIFGISSKPIWIYGRGRPGEKRKTDPLVVADQTEMFYLTSISWKSKGQKYHGYKDDILYIAFGIEDSKAAAIDIVAGDLLMDLSLC